MCGGRGRFLRIGIHNKKKLLNISKTKWVITTKDKFIEHGIKSKLKQVDRY